MRIVFCGTHGVGKSTLFLHPEVQEALRQIEPHWEKKHYRSWDGVGRYVHTKLNWLGERNKQRYFNRWYTYRHFYHRYFSGSRSIYDTYAYSRLLQGQWFDHQLMIWGARHVWYDHVFYIPIEFALQPDGIRYEDLSFQILHDRETRLIMDYCKVPYHTISGTVEERVAQIQTILGVT